MLYKGAISPCKNLSDQFLSNIFLRPKPDGTNRLILNLKSLNKFILTNHFKLEDGRTVVRLMNKGCYMAKLDLKDAYYLISVDKTSRKYLRFRFQSKLYEFLCLPFGLNVAPLVFTKILKPIISHLRKQGFYSVVYLDDILLFGDTHDKCLENIKTTKSLLEELGFIINRKKSNLVPNQKCLFLGLFYNSLEMTIELPIEKRKKIQNLLKLKINQKIEIREFARILGFLISCFRIKKLPNFIAY